MGARGWVKGRKMGTESSHFELQVSLLCWLSVGTPHGENLSFLRWKRSHSSHMTVILYIFKWKGWGMSGETEGRPCFLLHSSLMSPYTFEEKTFNHQPPLPHAIFITSRKNNCKFMSNVLNFGQSRK